MAHPKRRQGKTRTAKRRTHVHFSCGGCDSKGRALLSQVIYMPLQREDRVDYLFINNMDYFILERVTAHFLQRYKERYIDYNNINLQGVHPALYFFFNNSNRQMINYQPDSWTDEDLKEKRIYISNQGLLVTKAINDIVVYITFLDHDSVVYIVRDGSLLKLQKQLGTSEAPANALRVKLVPIKGFQLTAAQINNKLGLLIDEVSTNNVKLTFVPDKNNTSIVNPFSEIGFKATDVEPGFVQIWNHYGKVDSLLYVDTSYTNYNGAKFLAFKHDKSVLPK